MKDMDDDDEKLEALVAERHAEYRLNCLRELRAHQRSKRLLDALGNNRLPAELLLQVMGHLTSAHCRTVELKSAEHLTEIRQLVMGETESAKQLEPVFIESALKRSCIQLDFGGPIVAPKDPIPNFMTILPHPIRHLEILCFTTVACASSLYPAQLFRAWRAIASMPTRLPGLHTLELNLTLRPMCRPHQHLSPSGLNAIQCRSGFNKYVPLKTVVEQLLNDLKDYSTSTVKVLKTGNGLDRSSKKMVLSGVETAEEILAAALDAYS
jgi:hypothetical protein